MNNEIFEIIIKYNGDIESLMNSLGIGIEILSPSYAIIYVTAEQIPTLFNYSQIEYIEPEIRLALLTNPSMTSSCITSVRNSAPYNLNGQGTLIAILDSGIDYSHPDFINEDGTSRILSIWDQDGTGGSPPAGFNYGTEYTNEMINQALQLPPEQREQFLIHNDFNGHGTAVAGIAAGNGRASNGKYIGAAPDATLLVVKLAANQTQYFTTNTNLMRGIRYALNKAIEANMPLVINMSYGTNLGAHDGRSLFEQYIDDMADVWRTCIVVPTGNEGITGKHFQGTVSTGSYLDAQFTIQNGLLNLNLLLCKTFVDIFEFQILTYSGIISNTLNLRENVQNVIVGNTEIVASITQPTPYNEEQYILFHFRGLNGIPIPEDIWTIRIHGLNVVNGDINIWLPVTEISGPGSAFLNPSIYTTLTIPSTAHKVISVGGYDPRDGTFSEFSGRGFTLTQDIKPDIVAPAENIISTLFGSGYSSFTGTSFASPHVAGSCALLMQWGIIQGNDPTLYGQRVKSFLRLGATRNPNQNYPNPLWGYGALCVRQSLDLVVQYNIHNLSPYGSYNFNIIQAVSNMNTNNKKDINLASMVSIPVQLEVDPDENEIQEQTLPEVETPLPEINEQPQDADPLGDAPNIVIPSPFGTSSQDPFLQFPYPNPFPYNQIPNEYLNGLNETPDGINPVIDEKYVDFIVSYDFPSLETLNQIPNAYLSSMLYGGFAIVHLPYDEQGLYSGTLDTRIFPERAAICGLIQNQALVASGITAVKNQPYLNLTGRGVLVALIDTGIDYTSSSFIYEDGRTKIKYLWDQSIETGNTPEGFVYGTEYTDTQINEALANENPFTVVPSTDDIGHGTFIASVMAGRPNKGDSGAAPDAEIIAVKVKPAKILSRQIEAIFNDNAPGYLSSDIMTGVEYAFKKAVELGKPVIICLGMGTNNGAHDGLSFFERYLSEISMINGIVMICGVGNEGNMAHHFAGRLANTGDVRQVEFNVAQNDPGFMMNIWAFAPDRISISLTSPLGRTIERRTFTINERYNYDFVLESTRITVEYIFPNIKNGDQVIYIRFQNPTPGLWNMNIYGDLILDGRYHGWMPLTPFVASGTNFLQAEVETTVTIPSTAYNVMAVGAYNSYDGSIYISSGRGPSASDKRCPDLVAPGVNVEGIYPGDIEGTMTGTSVAAAITAGASALVMQWGIVQNNDPAISTLKMRTYLLLGTQQRPGITYPNNLLGYGELNLFNSFEKLQP